MCSDGCGFVHNAVKHAHIDFQMQKYQDEEIVIGQRIKPQTREQRRIQQDRDFLEK